MTGQKTEQPTPKRLRDLRKKGQVAQSKEVPSAALTIAFFALLVALLPTIVDRLTALILMPAPLLGDDFSSATERLMRASVAEMQSILVPFIGLVLVIGIGAYVLQIGVMFSPSAAAPSLKKLSPVENVKRIVSLQNLVEFGKSIFKVLVLCLVLFVVLRDGMQALVLIPTCGVSCLRGVTGDLLFWISVYTGLIFLIVAIADFAFQRWQFTRKNMMSKDEVKREFKESEGDPLIKGRRRQLHQELLARDIIDQSSRATVLITNPTHIAVAIYYDHEHTPLPIISAIGTDLMAKRMIEAAVAAGVPVMRNVPLARSLLEDGLVDQYIPSHLIEPLAEVLRALGNLAAETDGAEYE